MIDLTRLREIISYDAATGTLVWLVGKRGTAIGKVAGSFNKRLGYRMVGIEGTRYYEHRLAWFIHYGEMPTLEIDHINGDRADNRICNLRQATSQQNKFNTKKKPPRSSTGKNYSQYKGVNYQRGRWRARILINRKGISLGLFDTESEASAAYQSAAKIIFGEFSRSQ